MAETTHIEWADATINVWWGCTKVSPACANCYAETLAKRWGKRVWGPGVPREDHREGARKTALKLERQAVREGRRIRVFCESMSDWLDHEVPVEWLADLLALVGETPNLTWMLLTKRPELWRQRVTAAWLNLANRGARELTWAHWLDGEAPANVWVGTTVEDQERADERIPALLAIPARVRFLSCEPLLGPVDLGRWIGTHDCHPCGARFWPCCDFGGRYGLTEQGHDESDQEEADAEERSTRAACPYCEHADLGTGDVGVRDTDQESDGLHWIIAGGESGHGARPMHPDWARSLRDQATSAGVAFFFKQWGTWQPAADIDVSDPVMGTPVTSPRYHALPGGGGMLRVGKGASGRELDGRTWDELPRA